MVNDFFKGFLYTLGKILAFIFIMLVIGTLLTKIKPDDIKVERLPFKQVLMNLFFVNVHAQTYEGVPSSGKAHFMYTNGNNFASDWKSISSNSNTLNQYIGSDISSSFYYMGNEFSLYANLNGETTFNGIAYIPVVGGYYNNYTITDGLGISDFRFGIDTNFGVYNVSPNVSSFSHTCSHIDNVIQQGFDLVYCNYIYRFNFTLSQGLTGAYNFNFANNNTSSNRSAFYITITTPSSWSYQFPNLYTGFNSQDTYFKSIRPYLSITASGGGTDTTVIENNQQTIINQNDTIINGVDNINDTLTDTSTPDTNDFLDDSKDMILSDTPITDLLRMPYNLYQKFMNGLDGSCSSYSFGSLYGHEIIIPCINLENLLGSNLWSIIDILFSGFMILNIGELMIHDFSSLASLEDLFDETYTPKHVYHPKHGKE